MPFGPQIIFFIILIEILMDNYNAWHSSIPMHQLKNKLLITQASYLIQIWTYNNKLLLSSNSRNSPKFYHLFFSKNIKHKILLFFKKIFIL